MTDPIQVWRDTYRGYEKVGTIESSSDGLEFAYDPSYGGPDISVRLPFQAEPFSPYETELFFSALIPEGHTRAYLLDMLRANRDEYIPLLKALNNESIGALCFSIGEDFLGEEESYEPIEGDLLCLLAQEPVASAARAMEKTRLSLAGAMAKIGLYQDEETGEWLYPRNGAPSTHIIKAADDSNYPCETVNEAICMELARLCDLDVAQTDLISTGAAPLLVSRRFDRPIGPVCRTIGGHRRPWRLHQEDFCQVGGTTLKYEPTGAHYLRFVNSCIRKHCANQFGERMMAVDMTFFSYLVGNCDNHLKNMSILYTADWTQRYLAPMYDVADTTIYAQLKDEMGISFTRSRSIFDVRRDDIVQTVKDCGLPVDMAMGEFDLLAEQVGELFPEACAHIDKAGFGDEVDHLYDAMWSGIEKRRSFHFSERDRKTVNDR